MYLFLEICDTDCRPITPWSKKTFNNSVTKIFWNWIYWTLYLYVINFVSISWSRWSHFLILKCLFHGLESAFQIFFFIPNVDLNLIIPEIVTIVITAKSHKSKLKASAIKSYNKSLARQFVNERSVAKQEPNSTRLLHSLPNCFAYQRGVVKGPSCLTQRTNGFVRHFCRFYIKFACVGWMAQQKCTNVRKISFYWKIIWNQYYCLKVYKAGLFEKICLNLGAEKWKICEKIYTKKIFAQSSGLAA